MDTASGTLKSAFGSLALALALSAGLAGAALAQDRPVQDVLELQASATSEVSPDVAVITLVALREGADPAELVQEVDVALEHALSDARATAGVTGSTGGLSTVPRTDAHGQRVAWQVHGEIVLRSKDFGSLGKLAARLATAGPQPLLLSGVGFEISPELRQTEEAELVEHALAAFRARAALVVKTLGYNSYSIREINVGEASGGGVIRPYLMADSVRLGTASPAPVPLESGRTTLALAVHGSVQMRR